MREVADTLKDVSKVEVHPRQQGRRMTMLLTATGVPKEAPKPQQARTPKKHDTAQKPASSSGPKAAASKPAASKPAAPKQAAPKTAAPKAAAPKTAASEAAAPKPAAPAPAPQPDAGGAEAS